MPDTIRLNVTHCFTIKTPNKKELQKIASSHLSETGFKDFMNLYKEYIKQLFHF